MKIRLVGTAEEAETAAALIGTVMTVLEDSGPRSRRGDGPQIQRYLDVRLTPPQPPAACEPATPPRSSAGVGPEMAPADSMDLSSWTD
ncbi:hypothetical protein ACU635_59165 [[Actinomadura] parvosata]|uniref:hypothetical protein n=1 Tax=[Actinomadura] parvosata TaxID=1955412 RepID=UPI00406C4930